VIAGFVGTPAVAGGLADKTFVSLAPSSGTAYTVLSGASKTFSLTANEATSIAGAGRNLKFLVTDADSKIEPTASSVGRTAFTVDQTSGSNVTAVASTDVVTVVRDGSALAVGDRISFAEPIRTAGTVLQAANTVVEVTAVTSTTSFAFKASADVASDVSTTALAGNDSAVKVVREARASDGSYVVNSGSATDTANEVLILSTGSAETSSRTVTVEAWVDANGNDEIDATEYASPVRTVTFKKGSEITATVTLTTPALGDSQLKASVQTNPTLNGSQMSTNDVSVRFTRQGSTATLAASATDSVGDGTGTFGSTSWDSTNTEWDAVAYTILSGDNTPWTGLLNASDTVIAGTYTARPYIGSDAIAAAVSATVGSTQADDVKGDIVATADNDGGKNEDGSANSNAGTTVTVRTGKSVTITASVFDSSAVAVGAGVPVTATLSSVTGTLKVNGASSSDQELTDASGKVTFTVTNTSASASDTAIITIQAQNVSTAAKTARYTLNWDDATVTVYDLAVANAKNDLNRSIAKNGTVNFNFRVADQWAQALSGTFRLLVENTGNTVSSYYAAVTSGAATVSVTDGQIGGGSSITTGITVQKDVSGTWTAQTPTNTNSSNKISYTIGVLDQTDEVKLDADGANTFGGGANADDADTIATKATAAIDTRSSNAAVSVAGLTAATISGVVRHATTSAARAGARVTLTGGADMLFAANGVYQLGSITLVANASGQFVVDVYSNKAQTDTVVTVASGTASATKKVSFTVANNAGAKSWTLTVPASTTPGSTYLVKGKLTDEFGNALDTASTDNSSAAKFSVTYTGPGIVFGSLPTETNSSGEFSFAVLLGANDSGTATVTASYDYDGTGTTYTAAAASASVSVGAPAVVANIGSFSGRVAVRVENAKGSDVSVKIGKKWYKFVAKNNNYLQSWKSRKGTSVAVSVYVDGELQNVQTITVK
jgi:hypothetical protein